MGGKEKIGSIDENIYIIYFKGGDGLRNWQVRKHYEQVISGKTYTWKSKLTVLGKSQRTDRKWKLRKGVGRPRISA